MKPLVRQTLPLLAACACLLSGCLGGGIYSVQHGDYAQYEQFPNDAPPEAMPCQENGSCGVSLIEALTATCGPPELCNEEFMYADPGAMVSPTPKYHPLPTQPVFQPMYSSPMGTSHQAATDEMRPGVDDKSASSARWRGSIPQFTNWSVPSQPKSRVASNPLEDVTFPRLPAAYQQPPVLNPANANPILPNAPQQR